MDFHVLLLIIAVVRLKNYAESVTPKKIVLQNEMSEHCRRRVVSSIFLGRQVAESSAEVMHFSRLELPYSCSISVRTESGSNIILVIISTSEKSITSSCRVGHDQLLVYEMGETFGGYWGALPEYVFRQDNRNHSTYYTLKTTQSNEALLDMVDIGTKDYDVSNSTEDIIRRTQNGADDNYVMMEVPLVNVSGNLEIGEAELTHNDDDELFDLIYNVTPNNGVLYETSLMPLLQFSISKQKGQDRVLEESEPRYQLDYDMAGYTPDYRLMYRINNHRNRLSNRPYYSKKRLKFHKNNKPLFSVNRKTNAYQDISNTYFKSYTPSIFATKLLSSPISINRAADDFTSFGNHTDAWEAIASYLKLQSNLTSPEYEANDMSLLQKISNMKHNFSVYLQPNVFKHSSKLPYSIVETEERIYHNEDGNLLSTLLNNSNYDSEQKEPVTKSSSPNNISLYNLSPTTELNQNILSNLSSETANVKIHFTDFASSRNINVTTVKLMTAAVLPKINNVEDLSRESSTSALNLETGKLKDVIIEKSRKSQTGSLVDHESWENIVQVAPEMADLLNVTTPMTDLNTTFISNNISKQTSSSLIREDKKSHRKKRYLKALSIEHDGPRQLTTKEDTTTPDENMERFDSQRLAELVELQDDEIQGRVALHYYKNYVGSTIFNMCDYHEAKVRQVYLFNSSRIVISINNFTMDRITIVMTESRVARSSGCPRAHLECQVAGVRVCVHHMNACDGVPNCGAYDIYDEDRMLCGSSVGLHFTICLAACVFLMLLLTLVYTVHYWLKRCVPKVSQAFFVYTDKSENILYLDTIMRSPNDFDGGSRMVYHSSFYDDEVLSANSIKNDDIKILYLLRRCLRFLFCKKPKHRSSDDQSQKQFSWSMNNEVKRKFSFPAAEIRKISPVNTINVSVQTGDSLEMAHVNKNSTVPMKICSTYGKKQELQHSERELTTLRRVRGISANIKSSSKLDALKKIERKLKEHAVSVEEEIELRSTTYDRKGKRPSPDSTQLKETKCEISLEPPEQKRNTEKHLRFEEGATTIEPLVAVNDDKNYMERQHTVPLRTNRIANMNLDAVEEEAGSNSGRDFIRFWRSSKGKKDKKKTHLSLR